MRFRLWKALKHIKILYSIYLRRAGKKNRAICRGNPPIPRKTGQNARAVIDKSSVHHTKFTWPAAAQNKKCSRSCISCIRWQGQAGSNRRVTESKSVALPLGYTPAKKGKKKWGEWWGSNPRITEPQSAVLAASPHPPHSGVTGIRHMTNLILAYRSPSVNGNKKFSHTLMKGKSDAPLHRLYFTPCDHTGYKRIRTRGCGRHRTARMCRPPADFRRGRPG